MSAPQARRYDLESTNMNTAAGSAATSAPDAPRMLRGRALPFAEQLTTRKRQSPGTESACPGVSVA